MDDLISSLRYHLEKENQVKDSLEVQDKAFHERFGALMRCEREAAGFLAQAVAKKMRMTPSMICQLENGDKRWSVETAEKFLKAIRKDAAQPCEMTTAHS